ncbi:MAG: ATP-binding protein [Gallionella sp.]|nr:ATP-binding protein [Gallionella sp.]
MPFVFWLQYDFATEPSEMFAQAEQEKAILLLDEADSFLADRKGAQALWEVTQVNEILTCMENFRGLFICSTNLMARLDEASLRRFALKIRFGYLLPEQRWRLFHEHIGRRVRVDEAHCRAKLNLLNNLTPGDFACIRRQSVLLGENLSSETWLLRLALECRAKPDQGSRSIGFV